MTSLYAPHIPDTVIGDAVLAACKLWGTEAVTARSTPYDEDDTTASVWCFEVVGRHDRGWDIFGREILVTVDLASGEITFSDGE